MNQQKTGIIKNIKGTNIPYAETNDITYENIVAKSAIWTNRSFIDFKEVDFSYCLLEGIILSRVNMTNSNLSGANLIGANLIGANLTDAFLTGANLTYADLTRNTRLFTKC